MLKKLWLLGLILALFFVAGVSSQGNPCGGKWVSTAGDKYELTKMPLQTKLNYQGSKNMFIMMCGVSGMGCAATSTGDESVCQQDGPDFYSSGTFKASTYSDVGGSVLGVKAVYGDGSPQHCGSKPRKSTIYVLCDKSQKEGIVANVTESAACEFTIYIKSAYGCPGGGGGGGSFWGFGVGWIIIIIVIVLFILYLVAGIIFMYWRKEARGIDVIPNLEFWKDLPFLIWDGCKFFYRFCAVLLSKVSKGKICSGYTEM